MSGAASATADSPERCAPADPIGLRSGKAVPIDRVVALFSGAGLPPAASAETDDWSTSLDAVRGVATRLRTMQKSARDSVRDAQRSVREAEAAARAAEDRARHAEAMLRGAVARAERAEEQARAAAERADRAEPPDRRSAGVAPAHA
ncbi:hypothetical protein ACRAWG_24855 [Methylobacterium sp. P31]